MKAIKHSKIRFLAVLFAFTFVLVGAFSISFNASADDSDISAFALYAVQGGELLLSSNPNESIAPSSTVKIMSGLLFCEALLEPDDDSLNNKKLGTTVRVTADMLSGVGGRTMGLAAGDETSLEGLLYAAIGGGFNDATHVLAFHLYGGIDAFVDKMNSRAAELGASSTYFSNPTGLDHADATTTVNDTLKIALAASEYRAFMKITSFYTYKLSFEDGTSFAMENRNKLHFPRSDTNEWYNGNALGMNVGMTDAGGHCLVTFAEFNGAKFICVVMGADDEDKAYSEVFRLLSFAKSGYELAVLRNEGEVLTKLPVSLSDTYTEVSIILAEDIALTVPMGTVLDEAYTYELSLTSNSLKAPFAKGYAVGTLNVIRNGQVIASAPAVTSMGVEANGFLATMDTMREFFTSPIFFIILAVLLFGGVIVLVLCRRGGRRYSRRRSSYRRRFY